MKQALIDALTSPTLKHLREHWWDDEFTGFLMETLKPRPGNRILDVGCGDGEAEVSLGYRHVSQLSLYGIDIKPHHVQTAARETAAHNLRARFAVADAVHLPFKSESFDSIYSVAVLQHVPDVGAALTELTRVTRTNGRIVVVEPDNAARYGFSSIPAGAAAFEAGSLFFAALMSSRQEVTDPAIGPKIPSLFASRDIEVLDVRLFPVSFAQVGDPGDDLWAERRRQVEHLTGQLATPELRALGRDYLKVLDVYEREARAAGPAFVEIQNTILFATIGQKQ